MDRAMAMVQCKQYKAFKRDIKPNGTMTGDSLTAYEFLRANLEYVKVSHFSTTEVFYHLRPLDGCACHDQSKGKRAKLNIFTCKKIFKPRTIFWEKAQLVSTVVKMDPEAPFL